MNTLTNQLINYTKLKLFYYIQNVFKNEIAKHVFTFLTVNVKEGVQTRYFIVEENCDVGVN